MPFPVQSRASSSRVRFGVVALCALAASGVVVTALIWNRTARQRNPEQPLAAALAPADIGPATNIPGVARATGIALTTSAPPQLVAPAGANTDAILQARISDLEKEVVGLQMQLTNSAGSTNSTTNDSAASMNGTWKCMATDSCGALTRLVTVSGSVPAMTIHVVEKDNCGTYDWGVVPFNLVGAPVQGQEAPPYPCGFAFFSGLPSQGNFQDPHRLFLVVTFEPQGLLTVWGRAVICGNCIPNCFTNFMSPTALE